MLPKETRDQWTAGSIPLAVSMLGEGRSLTPTERMSFPGWGDTLADICVHDNRQAQVVAGLLGDAGFAAGNHIVLGDGGSSTSSSRWLLAHELVHARQQHSSYGGPSCPDPEREANALADRIARTSGAMNVRPGVAPRGFAESVVASYMQDLPGNLLLVIDVDDGAFVGGCVRAVVPHLGAKLIKKGVPKAAGNQIFDIHLGIMTNPAGETCFFIYESVSRFCDTTCYPTLDELKQHLSDMRDWLKDKLEQILRVVLPVAAAALLAYLIADALIAALAAAGILVLA